MSIFNKIKSTISSFISSAAKAFTSGIGSLVSKPSSSISKVLGGAGAAIGGITEAIIPKKEKSMEFRIGEGLSATQKEKAYKTIEKYTGGSGSRTTSSGTSAKGRAPQSIYIPKEVRAKVGEALKDIFTPASIRKIEKAIESGEIQTSGSGLRKSYRPEPLEMGVYRPDESVLSTPSTISMGVPTQNEFEDLLNEIIAAKESTLTPQKSTNIPSGVETKIYRDPLGGSTPIFEHIIQKGETLGKIAKKYGISMDEIVRINQDNKEALKSPDLIIAGKPLRIPVVEKAKMPTEQQVAQHFFTNKSATINEINEAQKLALGLTKKETADLITEEDSMDITEKLFGKELQKMQELYEQLIDMRREQNRTQMYQQYLEDLGLDKDIQRMMNLQKIIRGTREDVLKEAAATGGVVTQSQVEAVVNFRTGVLKQEFEALADVIDEKERIADRMMQYWQMDRDALNKLLDRELQLTKYINDLKQEAYKWDYDWRQDLMNKNSKKLEAFAEAGTLHTMTPNYLMTYADPEHLNYAGYTPEEISALMQYSAMVDQKRKQDLREAQEKLSMEYQRIQNELARIELSKKRLEYEMGGKEEKTSNIDEELLKALTE